MMSKNIRSVLLAALVLMSVVAGGVAATTEWQDASSADQNLDVLQGTDNSTHSYNLTLNTTELAVDSTGDEVVLVSSVNATNISGHAVTSDASLSENLTSGWAYDSDTGLWYRSYNLTATDSEVNLTVDAGVTFNDTETDNNWTISTAETAGETALAGGLTGDSQTVDVLANATENVTYEIIDHPAGVDATFESDIDNGTTVSDGTVEVDQNSDELTITLDAANLTDTDRGVGDAMTYEFVLNKSLGSTSETTVSVADDAADNVDVTGPDAYDDDNNQWTVEVTNISNASTVTATVDVSDVADDYNQSGAVMIADIDYTADVVGETVYDDSYDVEFTEAEAGGDAGRLIAFPGMEFFTGLLGGTWGAVAFWFLIGSVVIMAGMAIWQLREQDYFGSSSGKALGYFGIVGSTLAVIWGMTLNLDTIGAILLVLLAVALAIINIMLYMRGESMTVETGGGSGGATYVR